MIPQLQLNNLIQLNPLIEKYSNKHFLSLFDFLKKNFSSDFYITNNNHRTYINSLNDLKEFIRSMRAIFYVEDKGDCLGVISLWHSVGITDDGKKIERDYIKLNAKNENLARDLLTVLIWNFGEKKDLYAKFKADSKFIKILYEKKFHVFRDREAIEARKNGNILTKLNPKREVIYKREKYIPPLKAEILKD